MKKWTVKHTRDGISYGFKTVEGTSYTDAYVRFEVEYPGEYIDEITEVES